MSADDVLDQRIIAALRDFGQQGKLLQEMIEGFLVEAPSLMAEIERSLEDESHDTVARAAHRLRGLSAHMGARRLAGVAGELETAARAGSVQPTAAVMTTARTELDRAVASTRTLLS
jgi:two-component system sensor histidine kinase BarA